MAIALSMPTLSAIFCTNSSMRGTIREPRHSRYAWRRRRA
jgi:hypothetical protein